MPDLTRQDYSNSSKLWTLTIWNGFTFAHDCPSPNRKLQKGIDGKHCKKTKLIRSTQHIMKIPKRTPPTVDLCQTEDFVMIYVFAHLEIAKSWFLIWPLLSKMSFWVAYQMSRCDARLEELNRLRTELQRAMLKDIEKERDDWRKTTSEQVEKIRSLEERLKPQSRQLADAEVRANVKLHINVEHRKSLATPVRLCFITGWLGGLSLDRNEDQIVDVLSETRDLDIEDDTNASAYRSPPQIQMTRPVADASFGTTTT
nr:hypothetical protein [Tanacetum cinerariifolium]